MGPVTRTVGPGLLVAWVGGACGGTVVDRVDGHPEAGVPWSSGAAASSGAGGRITTGGATSSGAGGAPITVGVAGTGAEGPCEPFVSHVERPIAGDPDGGLYGKLPCTFRLPPPANGEQPDSTHVNVAISQAGGSPVTLNNVADPDRCGGNAWYYDTPAQPTQIILCPATCQALNASRTTALDLLFGCRTMGL